MIRARDEDLQILNVGTVHLANPGLDKFNVNVDDVLSERRQRELIDVVERLVAFRPNKVAVERVASEATQKRYELFRAEATELQRDEVEQIGFRVAARAGLDRVEAADVAAEFFVPELTALIESDSAAAAAWSELEAIGNMFVEDCQRWLREESIGQVLYRLNMPHELERALSPYRDVLLRLSSDHNDAGPRMAANWYTRNLRILGNVLRHAEPSDRILLLFGHGHTAVFQQLLSRMRGVALVDALEFLPAPENVEV